ncbi:RNase adapter RapZ [Propionicimonas sp.]|uniref:RNase adapter RapZ n=1 Tax=Propionicimonas sp. TaxID=1955623 RepID=UPI0018579B5A|nr:RNase adapter RapZ [Propionicimonas sp.]MBU3977607.1 RNase adapter RapZ [Actinomycetota bacterium]MBA3021532.1 RNase adapter RapZ [Propionicimonas sp.]MBU3987081.1 RNase adapter RapZ [Actinomycetota bacterium]MBU4008902.1 RNase adapter RapZ [Actinomycetota bacterium]MBU4065948.1 RNase adapter RapZ [Actinomycetota bacterium]
MTESVAAVRLLVITGLSGAGRRTAGHTLEDLGWFVVDNLPPSLLPKLIGVCRERGFGRVAVVLDVRSRAEFDQLPGAYAALDEQQVVREVLYLEASDEVIVRRQESVRRPLPLQGSGRLLDGVNRERKMLAELRADADLVIDTTSINIHQLSARVAKAFAADQVGGLRFTLMSFGFKHGIPIDADLVLDVRFLPNPHWVPALRAQTGLSKPVSGYVLGQPGAEEFVTKVTELIELIAPGYLREGKRHATVAIGCTGGKHRSTAIAEELGRRLSANGQVVGVIHRDLGLE